MAKKRKAATKQESNDSIWKKLLKALNQVLLPAAGLLVSAGLITLVANLATGGVQNLLAPDNADGFSWGSGPMILGMVMIFGGIVIGGWKLSAYMSEHEVRATNCADSIQAYSRTLLGIGFAVVLLSLLNFVTLAGLAHTGELRAVLGVAEEQPDYETMRAVIEAEHGRLETRLEKIKNDTDASELAKENLQNSFNELDNKLKRFNAPYKIRVEIAKRRQELQAAAEADRAAATQLISRLESELKIAQDAVEELVKSSDPRVHGMIRLVLLPGFAVLGGLFFFAGSLRAKRERCEKQLANEEPAQDDPTKGPAKAVADSDDTSEEEKWELYDRTRLWAGLWYRLGEAILFALVIFLVINSSEEEMPENSEAMLLLIGLLVGMFVKPAEKLVNGLAVRVLDAVKSLVK